MVSKTDVEIKIERKLTPDVKENIFHIFGVYQQEVEYLCIFIMKN